MHLYVFKAVGQYFGGAVGVVASTAEEALGIVQTEQESCRVLIKKFWEGPEHGWEPPKGKVSLEPFFLTDDDYKKWQSSRPLDPENQYDFQTKEFDHFVLNHIYPLSATSYEHPGHWQGYIFGINFSYTHEG